MQNPEEIIDDLKAKGWRLTPTRVTLVRLLFSNPLPLSIEEIKIHLQKSALNPNKTTIYREMQFFMERGLVEAVDFNDGITRFERKGPHHHHLICTGCKKITDVELDNELHAQEALIAKKANFKSIRHSLEFFGVCAECEA
jgi:Fur family transcriptional regulator, ferric uptake regulator